MGKLDVIDIEIDSHSVSTSVRSVWTDGRVNDMQIIFLRLVIARVDTRSSVSGALN